MFKMKFKLPKAHAPSPSSILWLMGIARIKTKCLKTHFEGHKRQTNPLHLRSCSQTAKIIMWTCRI